MAKVKLGKCPCCGELIDCPICSRCGEVYPTEFVDYDCTSSEECYDCRYYKKECDAWELEISE